MASSVDFVEYVCGQISGAGNIAYKKMFGEYAVNCNGKVVGLICDNQFFVKKTAAGERLLPSVEEAPRKWARTEIQNSSLKTLSKRVLPIVLSGELDSSFKTIGKTRCLHLSNTANQ